MSSIKEVAKKAGVAVGTVSRVLNGTGYVADKTKKKVEKAIKELNYIPNERARSFKRQHSGIVALILPTVNHPLFSALAYHLEKSLDAKGYKMMLCNSNFDKKKEIEYIELLKRNTIDGIVFISNSEIDEYIKEDTRIVTIDRHFSHESTFIASDNEKGGRLAANYLIEKKCSHIAYAGTFPNINTEVLKRRIGFEKEAIDKGYNYTIYEKLNYPNDMKTFANEFIDNNPDIDGVFTITDAMALEFINAYRKRGIRIPEDVQIIGYDGMELPIPGGPYLTSIKQSVKELGSVAATRILSLIDGKETPKKTLLPVTIVEGQTTK